MPVILERQYQPNIIFRNGYFNTMYPYAIRSTLSFPHKERERWATPDGDFIDVDFYRNHHDSIAILCHGLEGSSQSQYIKAISNTLSQKGFDICAINQRSCSGEMNTTSTMYHSGFTDDLHMVVQELSMQYSTITIVGFSMGGNIALKYASDGHFKIPSNVGKIVAVSVPIDLHSSSYQLAQWPNIIFAKHFLISLKKKMAIKCKFFPHMVNVADLSKVKNLVDFDNYFTAPLHGFADAHDYYAKCSALPFLSNLQIPTWLINAHDDPFLTDKCMPYDIAESNRYFHFLPQKHGGHVGFANLFNHQYWIEDLVGDILK